MLSILTCHSYFLRFDPKRQERGKPYPPLATLQVAAMLRKAGHRVSLFDAMLADGVEEFEHQLRAVRPDVVLLYEDNFNFLSKMCLGRMRAAACEMIALARAAGCTVIAAGSDVSDAPEPYLRAGADVTLVGEGLSALFDLLPRLEAGADASKQRRTDALPGATAEHDRLLPTPAFDGIPAWDLLDLERYRTVWQRAHGFFSLNMAASRGCPFRCTWCAKPIWGNRYLQRSATSIAQEMAYIKHICRAEHIWFADDIFGFRVDWVAQLAQALDSLDGSLPFTIQTRADLVSEAMARELAHAGCVEAWIGAESGSQRVLDAMNKGTEVAQVHAARARLKAAGIRVGFFIQIGYLEEDLDDILATRDLLETARPDDVGVSVSYPLPGTKFYELVREQLGPKTHWDDSADLAMLFQGTYTSEFYRAVRDLFHDQVALEKRDTAEARRSLDWRWRHLVSHEQEYRTQRLAPAAAAGI